MIFSWFHICKAHKKEQQSSLQKMKASTVSERGQNSHLFRDSKSTLTIYPYSKLCSLYMVKKKSNIGGNCDGDQVKIKKQIGYCPHFSCCKFSWGKDSSTCRTVMCFRCHMEWPDEIKKMSNQEAAAIDEKREKMASTRQRRVENWGGKPGYSMRRMSQGRKESGKGQEAHGPLRI